MEYLEGETLAERAGERARCPLEQALARRRSRSPTALDAAHRPGIVHRDLKPGNVMLTKTGAKLLDFGLAKLQPARRAVAQALPRRTPTAQSLTAEGTIVGTFQYMAPEQLEGKPADARTDLCALGAVLYEMATGKTRLRGNERRRALIGNIMRAEPSPPSSLRPMAPPALERLVTTLPRERPGRSLGLGA